MAAKRTLVRHNWRRLVLKGLGVVALGGFLISQLVLLVKGTLDHLWLPYAAGDVALLLGILAAVWSIIHRQRLEEALRRGSLVAGLLYGGFLIVTFGMVAANAHAVQLPGRVGPVYRYDPRIGPPDSTVVVARPEAVIVTHLERERVFPMDVGSKVWVDPSGRDEIRFSPTVTTYPIVTYEVGQVLIRRTPDEVWWDDDPTFVATIDLTVGFANGQRRDFVVEMISASGRRSDILQLFSQGYLTPTFLSWRQSSLRPR
ncbi:MAG: hypothetical protein M0T85_00890 [Dehalococcoidales bacterium]|nr:hypothetical protein [Dehalococcoidales bacterium]